MSFLKLCQISNEQYIESVSGEVILNEIQSFPQILSVEVIDWVDENEFNNRGKINSFQPIEVSIEQDESKSIRDRVFDVLVIQIPELIK